MSPTARPSISAQDSMLSHLSFAPPALETPSRFASLAPAHISPRSRRARALRALPRAAGYGLGLLALVVGLSSWIDWRSLAALATQAWRVL
jgi:hypothetical protein